METLQDDPDTASEFSGFAQKFDIPTQTALIVFFVTFTVISMAVSLVIWHFHHRYAAEQRRRHDLSSSPYLESYHSKRGRERMKSKNLSCASSTKALLAEPESAQLSEKSVSDELSRGGSMDSRFRPSPVSLGLPPVQATRVSRTYSVTLFDLYINADDDPRWTMRRSLSHQQRTIPV